jgi:hypothetical protein
MDQNLRKKVKAKKWLKPAAPADAKPGSAAADTPSPK